MQSYVIFQSHGIIYCVFSSAQGLFKKADAVHESKDTVNDVIGERRLLSVEFKLKVEGVVQSD